MSGPVKRSWPFGPSVSKQGAAQQNSLESASKGHESLLRFRTGMVPAGREHWSELQSLIQQCVAQLEHQSTANTELAKTLLAISHKASVMGEMTPSDELLPPQGQPMTMLTVPRLAELLAVDPRTIRRWRSAGHLPPALSVGGVIRWRAEVIDQWIADREGER